MSVDSSVSKITGLFLSSKTSSLLHNGYGGVSSFPGGIVPESAADHKPPSSAEVKNMWSFTSGSPTRLHCVKFRRRGKLTSLP
jgi:hypothetical protein